MATLAARAKTGLYADGRAAIAWLQSRGVGREQLVIVGNSIGSGVAVQMASEARPAALLLISPFTALPDLAAEQFSWLPARLLVLDRFENLAKIGKISVPILIMHGKADSLIPYSHALRLAQANRTAEFILVDAAGHELAYDKSAQISALDWLLRQPFR